MKALRAVHQLCPPQKTNGESAELNQKWGSGLRGRLTQGLV